MAKIVALTGAGISVASGLPTFDFQWRGIPARDLLTLSSFQADPERFYLFFREALAAWSNATPNAAHLALARAGIPIITQNIDGLHQAAGSCHVCELHGNLHSLLCLRCGTKTPLTLPADGIPMCACGGVLKPDVVLFDEQLHEWGEAAALLLDVERLLVIGTSLAVAPACHLPGIAAAHGARIDMVNDAAEEKVPALLAKLEREGAVDPANPAMHA